MRGHKTCGHIDRGRQQGVVRVVERTSSCGENEQGDRVSGIKRKGGQLGQRPKSIEDDTP